MTDKSIGTVKSVWRYLVKSMAGEEVPAIYVHETGLNGDRVYAFSDNNHRKSRSGLPYFTAREQSQLLLMSPKITREPDKSKSYPEGYKPEVIVSVPSGGITKEVPIEDPSVIAHIKSVCASRDIDITLDYRREGIQDNKPVSLIGLRTIERLSSEVEMNLDPRRFRENFYIEWEDDEPFFEDGLVGRSLQVGSELLIHVVKRNKRCAIPCFDPTTLKMDKRVLGIIAENHNNYAGVYAVVRRPGLVRSGDSISLLQIRS